MFRFIESSSGDDSSTTEDYSITRNMSKKYDFFIEK